MNRKYTPAEKQWIIQNAGKKKDEEAMTEFNSITGRKVSLMAYRRLRNRLGVKKESGRGRCEIKHV